MCFNAGKVDRILRVIVGLSLVGAGVLTGHMVFSVFGAVAIVTGAIGFCPLYTLLKLNTGCKA